MKDECGIISVPIVSKNALKLSLSISKGFGTIIRQVGTYDSLYRSNDIIDQRLELLPSNRFDTSAVEVIAIFSTQPLIAVLTRAEYQNSINVNSMLVLDTHYDNISLVNLSTSSNAIINISYIPSA